MSLTPWTDEAVSAAVREFLPELEALVEVPCLRGAMILALDAPTTDDALSTWDATRDEHRHDDPDRPEWEDQAPHFEHEPKRTKKARAAAMDAAREAARAIQG